MMVSLCSYLIANAKWSVLRTDEPSVMSWTLNPDTRHLQTNTKSCRTMAEETFSDPLYNLDIAISPYVDCFTLLSVIPRSDSKYAVKPDR